MEEKILEIVKREQKKNLKNTIVLFLAACITTGTIGVAAGSYSAKQVAFNPKDSNWKVSNVSDAIESLSNLKGAITGSIISYMGTTAPNGYLICDGTEYNISDYQVLADHIKDNFGSYNYFGGDGETTFKVPDLRGEFLRGSGTNSRTNQGSGAAVGIHQDATKHIFSYNDGMFWQVHSEAVTMPSNMDSQYGSDNGLRGGNSTYGTLGYKAYFTSRPTNTSVLYLIKY